MLSPTKPQYTLAQLEKEQKGLERAIGGPLVDKEWIGGPARGKEML